MKVSLNWVKQFVDFELPPIAELVERIGSQLGAVEAVEDLGAKYQGVLVAKVVSCKPHENSDHLNVCLIDDGGKAQDVERNENGYVQVVCGAPNVREGLTVAWLPLGSTVPESVGKDPFVLGKRELRGVVSNGMLASPRELALGDSHEGILEIDKDVEPGSDFAPVYKLDDYIIDIENKMFTHRPDCFGVLGVAREIAGILGHEFHSPSWYQLNAEFPFPRHPEFSSGSIPSDGQTSGATAWMPDQARRDSALPLTVTNEIPELVPRFSAVTLANVHLGPSPMWLQVALAKVGQKSISNIVDLTNFYMLMTGQPLHAYDYDKVKALTVGEAAEITVRYPKPGEKIKLINGKEIEPRSEAMMIASGDHLIGIGGVMGGFDTEVDANTRNVILEAANFDMYNIRRTSMAHGLFTDAVTRFNKGQSPLQTVAVLAKITSDIQEMAGAKVASELVDVSQLQGRQWVHEPVPVSVDFINTRLGLQLCGEEMKSLLENVEFQAEILSSRHPKQSEGLSQSKEDSLAGPQNDDVLTITAPFWRTDIETREDVVEEIGRLYGFDKLPLELPKRSIKPAAKDPMFELKRQVREALAKAGATEVLTYSFVHADLLEKAGQNPDDAFKLSNALSPELQHYRLSLTPSLLDKVHPNMKAGYQEFALFEQGKGHNLAQADSDNGLPMEFDMLELIYARSDKVKKTGAAYYEARNFLRRLANQFGVELEYRSIESEEAYPVAKPYDHTRSAQIFVKSTDLPLGMIGEYKANVRKALKLPAHTAGFGIGLQQFMQASKEHETIAWYQPISRFPWVNQDITFKINATQAHQPFHFFLRQQLEAHKPEQSRAWIGSTDIYQSPEDAAHKQFSFRLSVSSYERTLTDKEVSALLDTIALKAQEKFGAERV